ncbi:hypothetical protein [Mycobacteroides abscessus]|uniref:hypothetical protein n=1 Tax=Mycobacteroides abscessus TaxID=36809 RepID=UPI001F3DCAC7|nr:hypothetical protein [Mycobacteroides abscessus]
MVGNGMFAEPGDPDSIYPGAQSLYPHREHYERSPHPDSRLEPGNVHAKALGDLQGTAFEQSYSIFENARKEYTKHLDKLKEVEHLYSDDGYRMQIDQFQESPAAKAIDDAVRLVETRRDEAQADMEKVFRELSPHGDAAAESRASRYWHRCERLLDSSRDNKLAVAEEMVRKASKEELGTLLQELPTYLRSVGIGDSWIDESVAQHAPNYGKAKNRLQRAEQAVMVANANARQLRESFTNRQARPSTIPHLRERDPDK